MLSSMRNNRKILSIVLWAVIIAFISTIFVVWGIGSRENQASFVARVGDSVVTYEEYRNSYDNTVQQLRGILGDAYDEYAKTQNIDYLVIQELINRKLLLAEAVRLGVPASDFEVIEAIRIVPAFQDEKGRFDPEQYVKVLSYYRQTPAVFEASIRDDILVNKLQNLIRNGQYAVSDTALTNEYNYRGTMARISYFGVPVDRFTPEDAPSEEALASYYEINKSFYRAPARIKLKYIFFDENSFGLDNVSVDPSEIESYYAENISAYTVPESVVIRSIAVPVSDWNDETAVNAAKTRIDGALSELKKPGSDFIAAVKKYSDPTMAANDGFMGRIYRGQLQPDFEAAVFAVEPGGFTEILKTDYGYHIVKVDEKTPGKIYPLEEKEAEIADIIKNDKVKAAFRNYVLSVYKDILKAGNITAYMESAPENGIEPASTPLFSENEAGLPVFLSKPDAKKSVFSLSKTEISQLIDDGSVTYLFEVEEKIPSAIPALDEVLDRVAEDYTRGEAVKSGMADVEKTIAETGFEKAAENFGAAVSQSGEFKRSQPEDVFASESRLINAVFSSKPGDTIKTAYLIGDKIYAVKVDSILPPSSEGFESEKEAITSYIRTIKAEEALASYIDSLTAKAKIEINPVFLNNGGRN